MSLKLIINADDLGTDAGTDAVIFESFQKGVLTSATLVAGGKSAESAAATAIALTMPVGVHLSLSLGQACAPVSHIPDLVDEHGNLNSKARSLVLAGRIRPNLLAQIRLELDAQINRVRSWGLMPTHLDSHEYIQLHPDIFLITEELAKAHRISRMRRIAEPFCWPVFWKHFFSLSIRLSPLKWLIARVRWKQLQPSLAGPDVYFGLINSGANSETLLLDLIEALPKQGIVEICVHPGPEPVGDAKVADHFNRWRLSKDRAIEAKALVSPLVKQAISQKNAQLISYAEI